MQGFPQQIDAYVRSRIKAIDEGNVIEVWPVGLSILGQYDLHYTTYCESYPGPQYRCDKHSPGKGFVPRNVMWDDAREATSHYSDIQGTYGSSLYKIEIRTTNRTSRGFNPIPQDIIDLAGDLSQSITDDMEKWVADGSDSTVAAFVLLCLGLALASIPAFVLPIFAIRIYSDSKILCFGNAIATGVRLTFSLLEGILLT